MTGTVFVWKMLGMDSLFSYATRLNKRQIYRQILQFALTIATTLMLWKGLIVVTGVDSPVVVVLSGSMEPAFYRGDLLFLTNPQEGTIKVGDIVVFKIRGRDIPIVHRVIQLHGDGKGSIRFLTKGDNNDVDDRSLYASGQLWLQPSDIVGRVRGCFPYVGMITVLMNDNPLIKYGLLLAVAGFALIRREELSVAV